MTQANDEQFACIVAAVQRLPDDNRRVFTLRRVYGFSQSQIGNHMNMSAEEVQRHLVAAVKLIADSLDRAGLASDENTNTDISIVVSADIALDTRT